MSDELLPCPFCGGQPKSKFSMSTKSKIWCPECAVEMRAVESYPVWHTDDFLVSAWNTRVAVTDGQFALAVHDGRAWEPVRTCENLLDDHPCDFECSKCGFSASTVPEGPADWQTTFWGYCPNCGAKVVSE